MTKSDIIMKIQTTTGMTKKEATDVIECFFDTIKDILESGECLKIARFGNFEVKAKQARRGRNPQTGEEITIVPRQVITFKASSILRQSINNEVEQEV